MIGRQRLAVDDIPVKHPSGVVHAGQRLVVIIQSAVELLRLLVFVAQEKEGVGQTRRWIKGFTLVIQHVLVEINGRLDEELVGIDIGQAGKNQSRKTGLVSHQLLFVELLFHDSQGLIVFLARHHGERIIGKDDAIVETDGIHVMGAGGKESHILVVGINGGYAVEISQSLLYLIAIGHLATHLEASLRKHQTRVFSTGRPSGIDFFIKPFKIPQGTIWIVLQKSVNCYHTGSAVLLPTDFRLQGSRTRGSKNYQQQAD